ncbi:unnamed protein product [Aspergillus oryzae]|uniref:Unnamed protein product n=1 Tax=Aspergillus oryzae TaxID=5062 RepID=A0AAN4YJH6_ASPOZ|nr:unnamed protein product [Aspergillus oryzae]GMF84785.1 unnamed protein product [Aspergillus oryzae]GMG03448.1 unnamed protein product [Aspergillus oryzae]GMG27292.1 unnamed protein product [Aspergillus oryzae]
MLSLEVRLIARPRAVPDNVSANKHRLYIDLYILHSYIVSYTQVLSSLNQHSQASTTRDIISKTTYKNLPGPVGDCVKPASLATTATVPVSPTSSLIFTTGHIGFDLKTGALVRETAEAEFEAIFTCLDAALKNADASQGLGQGYRFISYLVHVEDEKVMQDVFWRRAPGHRPAWCTVMAKEINV